MENKIYIGMTREVFLQNKRCRSVHYELQPIGEPLTFGWDGNNADEFLTLFPQYKGKSELTITCPEGNSFSVLSAPIDEIADWYVWVYPPENNEEKSLEDALIKFSSGLPQLYFIYEHYKKVGLGKWLHRCEWQLMNRPDPQLKLMLYQELQWLSPRAMEDKKFALQVLALIPWFYRTYYSWARDDDVIELLLQGDIQGVQFHAENRIAVAYKRWLINPRYEEAFGQPLLRKLNGLSIGDYMKRTGLKKSLDKSLPKVQATKKQVKKI